MMKNILIDTNIALDFLLNRPSFQTSSEILSLIKDKAFTGWISGHCIDTLHYILRKKYNKEQSKVLLKKFLDGFIIIPTRNSSIDFDSKIIDFEDSIVEKGAFQFNLDAIITRNKKDFENSRIPVFTPEEFLESISPELSAFHNLKLKVPFLDLKAQFKDIYNEVDDEITKVISNTSFVLGKAVKDFEENFAEAHEVKHCIGLSSGTDGNHIALWSLGVGPGDEVILPANTFIATAWGATLCGAKPVFVDCEGDSYNIDPKKVEAAITSNTKAIVAVHLYGQSADIDPLREIANKYKVYLVEDAAQAHNAEYKGKKVGGLSDAASFSFYPGKNLGAYGEGGAVTTNNDEIQKKSKMIRDHGGYQKYDHQVFGHNYRMEGIQGAVLDVKLKYLDKWTEGRRKVATKYRELLSGIEEIILPKEMEYAKHVYHLFVVKVKSRKPEARSQKSEVRSQKSEVRSQKRDELQRYLNEKGIATGLHYPIPLHLQKCFEYLGYKKGDFPVTEELAETGLSLPMYPELSDEQIDYICDNLKAFFKK